MTEPAEKCVWCHESEGRLVTIEATVPDRWGRNPHPEELVVHPRHEAPTRDFLREVVEHAGTFVALLLGSTGAATVLCVALVAVAETEAAADDWAAVLFGPYLLLTGLLILRFPFATPETVAWLGIERSVRLTRVFALLLIGFGIWLLTLRL